LIEVYGDDVKRAHYVSKWCREFGNGRTDIGQVSTSRTAVNTAEVEELIFELLKRRFRGC
jgi:hypothetical protein